MKAEIITIGDEILIGQIVDTNSAWMAEQLNLAGVEVYQITSIHDQHEHILEALQNAEKNVDLVLLTGGLGPTKDDITKKALCAFFNDRLVLHEPTLHHIRNLFKHRNIVINQLNHEQALVPETCTVLPNSQGTAPGMWFERNNTLFVSMPGVPFEMKALMTEQVLPRLVRTGKTQAIFHKTVLTQGIPESMLAERLETWENALPPAIRLAYLPSPMAVRLRLSATGARLDVLKAEIEQEIAKLRELIPEAIYGYDDDQMADAIGQLLTPKGAMLAVAESCTGGYLSHLITSVPGASGWYAGSVTAYSNQVKMELLGVSEESLQNFGAVSEQVACEMAMGVKKSLHTGYAIATTGIAGPSGGSDEKPVGTVWVAVAGPAKFLTQKFVFDSNRERNILRASQSALQLLRKLILQDQQAV